jgi:hypothetical protein
VLTKIITAHDWLPCKCIPTNLRAARRAPTLGKTVLVRADAVPNAEIVCGWTRNTSRAE